MKKILPVILIVLIFLASGCITGKTFEVDESKLPKLNISPGPAYAYKPDLTDDWELVSEKVKLGQMPFDVQDELAEFHPVDAAMWEYAKGDERLFVWAKIFETEEDAFNASKPFLSMFTWIGLKTRILFVDEGAVGIFRTVNEPPPLLLYGIKDNVLIHIAYYNNVTRYNDANIYEDKRFLVSIAKGMLDK